jgi:hypothetical protein
VPGALKRSENYGPYESGPHDVFGFNVAPPTAKNRHQGCLTATWLCELRLLSNSAASHHGRFVAIGTRLPSTEIWNWRRFDCSWLIRSSRLRLGQFAFSRDVLGPENVDPAPHLLQQVRSAFARADIPDRSAAHAIECILELDCKPRSARR